MLYVDDTRNCKDFCLSLCKILRIYRSYEELIILLHMSVGNFNYKICNIQFYLDVFLTVHHELYIY